jgi:phosphomannomutase
MKKLIVFDLDGTLAESKSAMDAEMVTLLGTLLSVMKVAVISGGGWPQFERQLLTQMPLGEQLRNLSLLPTCGTTFYQYEQEDVKNVDSPFVWKQVYSDVFTNEEKAKIITALEQTATQLAFPREQIWGEIIEDRGSQITFSALGQEAPLEAKKAWDADFAKRKTIQERLKAIIPEFSVRLGGTTSIDITKLGIDKAYGIRKLQEILCIDLDEMLFVGDALFPGGNDYPVKEAGVVSIAVRDPSESKRVIETVLACSAPAPPTKSIAILRWENEGGEVEP